MTTRLLSLTTALCLSAAPLLAVPATQEGADRMAAAFATYFGSAASAFSVVPQGDTYALTLDAAPLLALGKDAGLTGTVTPVVMSLTDNGDGTWGVTSDQDIIISVKVDGALDLVESLQDYKWQGTFDEKLMTFSSFSGSLGPSTAVEKVTQAGLDPMEVTVSFAGGTFDGTGVANPAGGVDMVTNMAFGAMSETIPMPMDPSMPPVPVTVSIKSQTLTSTLTGLRMDGLLPIAAWFVAHPDNASKEADKAGFKALAQAALPGFQSVIGTGTFEGISVETPMGTGGLAKAGFEVELNGLIADGKGREAISLEGLTLPQGIIPPWAEGLMPAKASIDVQVTDFNPADMIDVALGFFDLPANTDPDPDFENRVLAAFMPKGYVTIGLNPGAVEGNGYKLTYEGTMAAGPDTEIPTGTAKITMTGMDALIAGLDGAPDDIKMQATMGLGMVRGLGKDDGSGTMVWEIDGSTPGKVLINGMDLSSLGGGN